MQREQIIKQASHLLVGALAVWVAKRLGLKQAALPAALLMIGLHAYLDVPVARLIDDTI